MNSSMPLPLRIQKCLWVLMPVRCLCCCIMGALIPRRSMPANAAFFPCTLMKIWRCAPARFQKADTMAGISAMWTSEPSGKSILRITGVVRVPICVPDPARGALIAGASVRFFQKYPFVIKVLNRRVRATLNFCFVFFRVQKEGLKCS